ncbi:MAG TPA: hypothetical protein LFV91_06735, partial [Rickettsia endosymbiont of Bembidion nr. Transversale]|nr:hypothetical protein [Rickettsia endosymbiont of Bembidion nr. Transversale]
MLATSIEVQASPSIKLQIYEASSGKKQEATFESIHLSSALPDVVPTFPLPDLIPSNPPVTPPPPPPMPDIVPPVILPDVVPVPPMAPSMPDLLSDATPQIKPKSGFIAAMKEIAKGNFKLKKVKKEPKPVVVSSDGGDLMSQLYDTLERRRSGISGEKKDNKFKQAAKQVIVLNAEEERAREAEIANKIAANKEKSATLRKQKEKEWAMKAKQIEAEVEIEKQRKAAEHAKAIREQKAKDRVGDGSMVIAGIDPILHNNMVADLRQEISSLKDQLTLKGNVTAGAINDLDLNGHARSKRSLEDTRIVETKDQSTSTEDLIVLEDRLYDKKLENWGVEEEEAIKKLDEVISTYSASDSGYDDEALEDSGDTSSIRSSDINSMGSEVVLQSKPIVSEIVQDELLDIEKELQSQQLKEEEAVEAVEDILKQDVITDTIEQAGINISPASPQAELAKRANIIAKARDDLRFGSKA